MPATPRKAGSNGAAAAESPGAANAQAVAVDSLGLNIHISSDMEVCTANLALNFLSMTTSMWTGVTNPQKSQARTSGA